MSRKNELRSTNLLADLNAELPDAEQAVVSAAVAWADQGDAGAPSLKDAVTNLVAIRSAIAAMSRVHGKNGKAVPEPATAKV